MTFIIFANPIFKIRYKVALKPFPETLWFAILEMKLLYKPEQMALILVEWYERNVTLETASNSVRSFCRSYMCFKILYFTCSLLSKFPSPCH